MFGFGKKKQPSFPDKVWKTKAIAWKQLATEALQILHRKEFTCIVFFFESELKEYQSYLESMQVPVAVIDRPDGITETTPEVLLVSASTLSSDSILIRLAQQNLKTKLNFLFAGHYPLPDREQELLEKINERLKDKCTISFWISLEDPLMQTFGGDHLASVLDKMGIRDDECVEHPMVTRSILRAREKIAAHISTERQADSVKEWFSLNVHKR